jgi:hypothetical protein
MFAAQLVACHNASMECYRGAMLGEQTFEGRGSWQKARRRGWRYEHHGQSVFECMALPGLAPFAWKLTAVDIAAEPASSESVLGAVGTKGACNLLVVRRAARSSRGEHIKGTCISTNKLNPTIRAQDRGPFGTI